MCRCQRDKSMGHLRLFTVLMGVLSAAYLLMCLVAPSELTLQWEGACSESPAVGADDWELPSPLPEPPRRHRCVLA